MRAAASQHRVFLMKAGKYILAALAGAVVFRLIGDALEGAGLYQSTLLIDSAIMVAGALDGMLAYGLWRKNAKPW